MLRGRSLASVCVLVALGCGHTKPNEQSRSDTATSTQQSTRGRASPNRSSVARFVDSARLGLDRRYKAAAEQAMTCSSTPVPAGLRRLFLDLEIQRSDLELVFQHEDDHHQLYWSFSRDFEDAEEQALYRAVERSLHKSGLSELELPEDDNERLGEREWEGRDRAGNRLHVVMMKYPANPEFSRTHVLDVEWMITTATQTPRPTLSEVLSVFPALRAPQLSSRLYVDLGEFRVKSVGRNCRHRVRDGVLLQVLEPAHDEGVAFAAASAALVAAGFMREETGGDWATYQMRAGEEVGRDPGSEAKLYSIDDVTAVFIDL